MPLAPPEELYQRIWDGYTESDKLDPELAKTFSRRFNWEFLKLALLPSWRQHYGLRVQQAVGNMVATAREHDMFDVALEGKEELADRDLIFGNHQGPREECPGQGGLETIFGVALLPYHGRFLMKSEILQLRLSLKKLVTALSQRKATPIAFNRPKEGGMHALVAEQKRVFPEVFRSINEEDRPVVVYPEGTRSSTGKILPFMSPLFRTALTDYVVPRMQAGEEPRIGLKIADTLQVFPHGRGKGAQLYRKKMTIRGMQYDPGELMDRIDSCDEPLDSPDLPLRDLTKFFTQDVRRIIRDELSTILEESLAM